jgi:uncharacterized OsmC-like protein
MRKSPMQSGPEGSYRGSWHGHWKKGMAVPAEAVEVKVERRQRRESSSRDAVEIKVEVELASADEEDRQPYAARTAERMPCATRITLSREISRAEGVGSCGRGELTP